MGTAPRKSATFVGDGPLFDSTLKPALPQGAAIARRQAGRYYTEGNPFRMPQFLDWATRARLGAQTVLEPFAGANHLIRMLRDEGLCAEADSFDLTPGARGVRRRDTLKHFPKGYGVCVTNPPWLARNSASRLGLDFPACRHDDLYKHCLELCLAHCTHTAAILPATFLQSGLFRDRLHSYTLLHTKLFQETDNPVCLALFGEARAEVEIYHDTRPLGTLAELEAHLPREKRDRGVRFNDPRGTLGFVAFDNTRAASIRFCTADEIASYPVKHSSRFFARISGDFTSDPAPQAASLNRRLKTFRERTDDVFLTPFKGIRKDGCYRRRMSFALARRFINAV